MTGSPDGAGWCTGCWAWCPGHDPDGFCLLTDRQELSARLARSRPPEDVPDQAPAPEPAVPPPSAHPPAGRCPARFIRLMRTK